MKKLESTFLGRALFWPDSPHSQFVRAQALESYADIWSSAVGATGLKKHSIGLNVKALLVACVEKETGNWHDEFVSALIAAVTDKPLYDADAHRQWRHENKDLVGDYQAELRQTNHPKPPNHLTLNVRRIAQN